MPAVDEGRDRLRVLAIEPFYGGSHRAFLDGWRERSRHLWTLIAYSPHHWKWRSRHASISAAADIQTRWAAGERWDVLFCSDMLNLAELKGLVPEIHPLPSVAYFHENQLTYPVRESHERDYHFAVANFVTGLAADRLWFNSEFHRRDFLEALPEFWRRMPDHRPGPQTQRLWEQSEAQSPGVDDALFDPRPVARAAGARPEITWAARWEFDKNPGALFDALQSPELTELDWAVHVLGQRFKDSPPCFAEAQARLSDRIHSWGEVDRGRFVEVLQQTDIFVSTAIHEFFGIAAVEAIAAGALPLLPNRLAYPELLDVRTNPHLQRCFYQDDRDLAAALAARIAAPDREGLASAAKKQVERFGWRRRAAAMDDRLHDLVD